MRNKQTAPLQITTPRYLEGKTLHKGVWYHYTANSHVTTDDSYFVSVKAEGWEYVNLNDTLDDLATDIEFIHGIRVSYITGRD